eukprot:12106908-Alexandrium_andersonii.AAC.1
MAARVRIRYLNLLSHAEMMEASVQTRRLGCNVVELLVLNSLRCFGVLLSLGSDGISQADNLVMLLRR